MFFFIIGIIVVLIALGVLAFAERKTAAIFLFVVAAILIVISCVYTIPESHTGLITAFGKVERVETDPGMNFKAPWKKTIVMDNRVQKQEMELSCFTADLQEVHVKYSINFQLMPEKTESVYKTIGKNYFETIVTPASNEGVKAVVALYNAEQLIGRRNELSVSVSEEIVKKLDVYDLNVKTIAIEDIDFTDSFTNAVEAKQVAEQNKLKAETEAEQRIIEANAQAEIQKVEADAYAYETTTKAEAEAAANQKIAASLTQALIDYEYAQTWDGKYPTYYGGDGMIHVIN